MTEKFWYVPEGVKEDYLKALGVQARTLENAVGYSAFYELVHGHPPPKHVTDEYLACIEEAVETPGLMGALIWAARGFWKSDSITVIWVAWQIGLHPTLSNLIIAVNDSKATTFAEAIADLIDHSPGWKYAFPHVWPDKQKGWGANGYEVKCTHWFSAELRDNGDIVQHFTDEISYDEWRAGNDTRKDPTLKGVGYKSGDIVGAHPTGVLLVDDIHDEGNTSSSLEVASVVKRVQDTILPIRVKDEASGQQTKTVFIGTPWTKDDAYHAMKETGRFAFRDVPVMRQAPPNQGVYIEYQKLKGWYKLTWPERFGVDGVKEEYDVSGYRGFMRMYLLTIIAASEAGVRYISFPADQVDAEHKVVTGGLDYASVPEPTVRVIRTRSFMALLLCAHLPQGGVVIFDGVFDQLTRLQTEAHMNKFQGAYPLFRQFDFELDGKGEEAYVALMQRNPLLRVNGVRTGNKNKFDRFENEVKPDFESGLIMVSDAQTDVLNKLRESLENFPYGNMDILDACYYIRTSAVDALTKARTGAAVARAEQSGVEAKKKHPFNMKKRRGVSYARL